jgi:hypothetical protein
MTAFDSAYEKLRWAKQQLGALDEACNRFLEGRPYGYASHFEVDGFEQVFNIKIARHPPSDITLLVGDILHNSRAALDHAVFGLAVEHTPSLSADERGRLQFPIVRDVTEFKQQKRRGRLWGVPAKQRTEIQRLQPYYSTWPNVWLGLLSELNNTDKHRFVHVTPAVVQWAGFGGLGDSPGQMRLTWSGPFLKKDDAEIVRVRFVPANANVEVEFIPSFVLAIAVRQIPVGAPIESAFTTMESIVRAVEETLGCLKDGPPEWFQFLTHRSNVSS